MKSISALLDNSLYFTAVTEVYTLADDGSIAGFEDGLAGKPKRENLPELPKLYSVCYDKGYEIGLKEKKDKETAREIERELKYRGLCLTSKGGISNLGRKKIFDAKSKTTEGIMSPAAIFKTQQGAWKKYIGYIVAVTVTGVAAGLAGMMVGKKQAMKEKRDLGITDQSKDRDK